MSKSVTRPMVLPRCPNCGEARMQRERQAYEYAISHDGRAPVTIRIPDLDVMACQNPACRTEHAGNAVVLDDAALRRIGDETCKQLGLLMPREIREKRKALGMSQLQLFEALGLGGNSLSRWEKGRVYQSRAMDTLLRLYFDVPEVRKYVANRGAAEKAAAAINRRFSVS